ncbi:hypothetical protein CXB51_024172 [Gossypium anomalum]|uniref:Uncharacterized protein n=1 Tax=Gossypium anomalum TaxID=47600 RepID=A0A8J5Z6N6_9ROSI|nr:hypothetical protein CXB51_024172 [Gossypium anomalum]
MSNRSLRLGDKRSRRSLKARLGPIFTVCLSMLKVGQHVAPEAARNRPRRPSHAGAAEAKKYLGNPTASSNVSAQVKGKEILGGPPLGFPRKEFIDVPHPLLVTSHTSSPRSHSGWFQGRFYKLDCPRFDGSDFRAGGQNSSNALLLREYLTHKERFDPSMFKDPMSELVTMKEQGPQILVEGFHNAKQVECILSNSPRKVLFNGSSPLARFRFAATPPTVSNKLVAPSHNGAPVQPVTTSSSCSNASRVPSKGISPALIAERKQKGLCFWCGAKYHIGRKCVKA